jgi:glutamine synthetase
MLAAALDGIDKGMKAPKALNNINLYHLDKEEREKLGVTELPGSLAESLKELEKDEALKNAMGGYLTEAYLRAKWEEWDEFRLRVTDYEIERYLETA